MTEPTPTIYSYYTPEVRNTVQGALMELNRRGRDGIHDLLKQNYEPGLDNLHLPLMEKYEAFARSEGVIGLENFAEKYFVNGSSEAIFHMMVGFLPGDQLYQLEGEYQGYEKYAQAAGRPIKTVPPNERSIAEQRPGIFVLSNPASKDGNIVSPSLLAAIMDHHRVIIDLAYMGMTRKPLNLNLTDPRVVAVVGSLSKPFGLYYYRVGFCYSKYSIASLYGNKWFKNALSIKIGEAVLDMFTPKRLAAFKDKYFQAQVNAVSMLNELYNLDNKLAGSGERRAKASDVWLLAHAPLRDFDPVDLRPFKRADQNYRFCLTPYYMEWENG